MCDGVSLQDLTQYNTAHNRQISMVGIKEDERPRKRKYRPTAVSVSDQEEIINPGVCGSVCRCVGGAGVCESVCRYVGVGVWGCVCRYVGVGVWECVQVCGCVGVGVWVQVCGWWCVRTMKTYIY